MSKLSSYQKLKQENRKLKKEIRELVVNPESSKSKLIATRVDLEAQLEESIWFGNPTRSKSPEGIFPQVRDHRILTTHFLSNIGGSD